MALLTIVGLGPAGPELLTREAADVLAKTAEVHVRTRRHPTLEALPFTGRLRSFDHLYRSAREIDEVYAAIADRLIRLASRRDGVTYAVPGHPLIAERSVRLTLERARAADVPIRIVAGLSFVEPVLAAAELDPFAAGLQVLDGADVVSARFDGEGPSPFPARARPLDPTVPALIGQVDSSRVLSGVKLTLLTWFPPEHDVVLVSCAGGPGQRVWRGRLAEVDRQSADHLTTLVVPALERLADRGSFDTLRHIVSRLRAPDGCPWDREQTHASLKRELVEETYEVVDAVERGVSEQDWAPLAEELGDLLMNVLLHVQIADEAGTFSLEDVLTGITDKLIRRHPHVFGDVVAATSDDVLRNWDRIKRAEKSGEPEASRLGQVAASLPALIRAQAIQRRARRTGFTWPTVDGVWAKLHEEIEELRAATTAVDRAEELGDVLWMAAELGNWVGADAEDALRATIDKFYARFHAMEAYAAAAGRDFAELPIDDMMALWQRAKQAEKLTP